MEDLNKSIDDLVEAIINSKEYKKCVELKEKMNDNEELMNLINDVKNLQKSYIKNNYDEEIKQRLEDKRQDLEQIPIYSIYNENLKIVNDMINLVKDELNKYFYDKLN